MKWWPWGPRLAPKAVVEVTLVDLRPGDTLVICYEKQLTVFQCERIKAMARSVLDGEQRNPIMVLDAGASISIIRRQSSDLVSAVKAVNDKIRAQPVERAM